MSECKYDAFISYRRSDGSAVARWLRRQLEGFKLPKPLRKKFGRKLRLYLDTAYERGTSDFYENSIKPALLASRYLIVVATPHAKLRKAGVEDWIQREIADFSAGPNGRNVVAVRGAGGFDDALPADLERRFPNIEIVDLRGAGRFWYLNPVRATRLSAEKLKLIAPLLNIPPEEMPKLSQEEDKRQQIRLGTTAGAAMGVFAAVSGLSVFALNSRNQATRALEDSMFATGSMVLMSKRLTPVSGSADERWRRLLINQGCDLIDKLSLGSGVSPQIEEQVTCRLERALARERLDEHQQARRLYADAIRLATARHRQKGRSGAGEQLLEARLAFVRYLSRTKDGKAATAELKRMRDDARRLAKQHKGRDAFLQSEAEALGRLGNIYVKSRRRAQAADAFIAAANLVTRTIENTFGKKNPRTVAWLTRLRRRAAKEKIGLNEADAAHEQMLRSLKAREFIDEDAVPAYLEKEFAMTEAMLFLFERRRGRSDAARSARSAALAAITRITKSQSASPGTKRTAARLKAWIEKMSKGMQTGSAQ